MRLEEYQRQFFHLCLSQQVLRFGEFTLKSGRVSPYFFNAGLFNTGTALAALGRYYAACIADSGVEFDLLFGPAYKGIALAASTAIALAEHHGRDLPYCFNRKEAKDHGEGGVLIGAPMRGRVLVIDDVMSAGTAFREAAALIAAQGATLAGAVICLDRQERAQGQLSAVQQVEQDYAIPVLSIAQLDGLITFLAEATEYRQHLPAIEAYRATYGAAKAGD